MSATPFLERWFETMDSDTPERVLDHITDDFTMSVQFSRLLSSWAITRASSPTSSTANAAFWSTT